MQQLYLMKTENYCNFYNPYALIEGDPTLLTPLIHL